MNPTVAFPPSLDLPHYLTVITNFFVSNTPLFESTGKSVLGLLIGISFPVSIMLIIGIVLCIERLKKIRAKEEEIYNAHVEPAYDPTAKADPEIANRWRKVIELVDSTNQNDWRQAIIEADILLEEILTQMGYQGNGIGEKLSRAEKGDFKTLEEAGEAHGVRNRLAHDGSAFLLSQHEAKRVINLYKIVFESFFYI